MPPFFFISLLINIYISLRQSLHFRHNGHAASAAAMPATQR